MFEVDIEVYFLCTVSPGGKPHGLSLKVACQVSSQAAAYMVKMFSR